MSAWSLSRFADIVGGRLVGKDAAFSGISTDSRQLVRGDLFVALTGPNFDGHEFVSQALEAGASGAVVVSGRLTSTDVDGPVIEVADPLAALGAFAADWRRRHELRLVAVTGSNGKTTVRSMLTRILETWQPGSVVATRGNFNNAIGLPLCLLEIRAGHRFGVFELGANHPGEIDELARMAGPDVGVITNAAAAHLEGFGSITGVAHAKGELLAALGDDGVAVINGEDAHVAVWRELAGSRERLEFGFDSGQVRLAGPPDLGAELTRAELVLPSGKHALELPLPGRHNLANALAAAAAAHALGVPGEEIVAGLARVQPQPGRMEPVAALHGARLIHDSYNANPDSLRAAMQWLSGQPGERWLVLGDMAELGDSAQQAHRQAGEEARQFGIERLFTLGDYAAHAAKGFGKGAEQFARVERLREMLRSRMRPGVVVLVKGSRRMGLEKVVDALRANDIHRAGGGN